MFIFVTFSKLIVTLVNSMFFHGVAFTNCKEMTLKAPSFAPLISRYILRLGQAAQKQQRPRCPNPKMYLEIRRADERLLNPFSVSTIGIGSQTASMGHVGAAVLAYVHCLWKKFVNKNVFRNRNGLISAQNYVFIGVTTIDFQSKFTTFHNF